MNSKQIETVLELAETLNFSRAAENLYLSQPTITYQLNELEKEIGFGYLTAQGKVLFLHQQDPSSSSPSEVYVRN